MLTYTIGYALKTKEVKPRGDYEPCAYEHDHMLYLIGLPDTAQVLYAGQSHRPFQRLRYHVQNDYEHQIGQEIRRNAPASNAWQIVLLTVDECEPMVQRHLPTRYDEFLWKRQEQGDYSPSGYFALDLAEIALIRHYQPPFNTVHKAIPKSVMVQRLILDALESEHPDYRATLLQIGEALNLSLPLRKDTV